MKHSLFFYMAIAAVVLGLPGFVDHVGAATNTKRLLREHAGPFRGKGTLNAVVRPNPSGVVLDTQQVNGIVRVPPRKSRASGMAGDQVVQGAEVQAKLANGRTKPRSTFSPAESAVYGVCAWFGCMTGLDRVASRVPGAYSKCQAEVLNNLETNKNNVRDVVDQKVADGEFFGVKRGGRADSASGPDGESKSRACCDSGSGGSNAGGGGGSNRPQGARERQGRYASFGGKGRIDPATGDPAIKGSFTVLTKRRGRSKYQASGFGVGTTEAFGGTVYVGAKVKGTHR